MSTRRGSVSLSSSPIESRRGRYSSTGSRPWWSSQLTINGCGFEEGEGGEDGAGGAGGGRLPSDDERKSALQRQLEATEEQLGSLVQLQELSLPLPLHASAHHGAEEQLGSLVQETLGSEGVHSGTLPFATVQAEAAQPKPKAPERPQAEQPANEEGDEHGAGEATGYDLPMDLPQQAEAPPTARLKEEL